MSAAVYVSPRPTLKVYLLGSLFWRAPRYMRSVLEPSVRLETAMWRSEPTTVSTRRNASQVPLSANAEVPGAKVILEEEEPSRAVAPSSRPRTSGAAEVPLAPVALSVPTLSARSGWLSGQ